MIYKSKTANISLNVQHDYITLRTPNGNYTNSRGGAKASGGLARTPGVFKKIDDFCEKGAGSLMDKMQMLLNPEVLSTLFPEWDKVSIVNISVGDTVKFNSPIFSKKYPGNYKVLGVAKKYATLQTESGKIGFEMDCMEKI